MRPKPSATFFAYAMSVFLIAGVETSEADDHVEFPMAYHQGAFEQEPYGPSALRVAPDGTFWIVNPADNSLTNVLADGRVTRTISLESEATGLTDIRIAADGSLTVLDQASEPPAMITLSANGAVRDRRQLGEGGMTSISADSQQMDDTAPDKAVIPDRWTIVSGTDNAPVGILESESGSVDVVALSGGVVRGIRVLLERAHTDIFVLVEEVVDTDPITVDATVRRYTPSGDLLGIARILLADQYTFIEHPVAVTQNGDVYLLETRPGYVRFGRVHLEESIPAMVLPDRVRPVWAQTPLSQPVLTASDLTRGQIIANAMRYMNNEAYYDRAALTGCTGRSVPSYLAGKGPGTYRSVAYAWGKDHSVAAYNSAIARGVAAGDTDKDDDERELSCVTGVDCSGYVSRVWEVSGKLGTCDLANNDRYVTRITSQEIGAGDVIVLCDRHVVLVDGVTGKGEIKAFESTTTNRADRVVHTTNSWSRFNHWKLRRYTKLRVEPPPPVHVNTTVTPRSGNRDVVVTFESTWKVGDGTPMTTRLILKLPSGDTKEYAMDLLSGAPGVGAKYQMKLRLRSRGQYKFAISVTTKTPRRTGRYPESGYVAGPKVN